MPYLNSFRENPQDDDDEEVEDEQSSSGSSDGGSGSEGEGDGEEQADKRAGGCCAALLTACPVSRIDAAVPSMST